MEKMPFLQAPTPPPPPPSFLPQKPDYTQMVWKFLLHLPAYLALIAVYIIGFYLYYALALVSGFHDHENRDYRNILSARADSIKKSLGLTVTPSPNPNPGSPVTEVPRSRFP